MRSLGITATLIFVLDQITKYWVLHVLNLDRVRSIDLLPPWVNLRMAWNQGMNFGLMASSTELTRWLLIGIGLVICIWVIAWVQRSASRIAPIAGGMLVGGALGNIVDRLAYGAVADFLNMSLPNWTNPYSFNVADIAIFAGAIGLILMPGGSGRGRDEPPVRRKPAPRTAATKPEPVLRPAPAPEAPPKDAPKDAPKDTAKKVLRADPRPTQARAAKPKPAAPATRVEPSLRAARPAPSKPRDAGPTLR
ncbi:signal peptidase II [Paracoccus sp. p4-l81]|uniref:signal peptidase II n=1 Tax=unclassified Paracoccus (in: a-proteobacteria) TaxID=2688777 RepID=UPI0035B92932